MSEIPGIFHAASTYPQLKVVRKTGNEPLHLNGNEIGTTLLDFWQWSVSDLVSNVTRGVFAEFLVATALGIADEAREEWGAFDLRTKSGLRIEVKSCAYLQRWDQKRLSTISFVIPKTRAWDAATNERSLESKRQAQVYVFAILAHQDKSTLDPLNLDQWHFYPVLTRHLDSRERSQHSITLKSLQKICAKHVTFAELPSAIAQLESELKPESESIRQSN